MESPCFEFLRPWSVADRNDREGLRVSKLIRLEE
jgi:hypothetical protein